MVVSSRAIVVASLGVLGVALLVGPSLGQQKDSSVSKTSSQPPANSAKPPAPAAFGTIDMTAVFKNYDKVKYTSEEFQAAALAKKNELMKIMTEMQTVSESLANLKPGTPDYKKHEDRMSMLKAQGEAGRESAEREFAMREATMLATIYKEVQEMVAAVAKLRKMTYVMRVSNDPITSTDPNSAMTAINRTVVYFDGANDITNDVVYNLNRRYKAQGGPAPKGTSSSTTAAPAAAKPAGN
jgi:outer membrane protein